MSDQKVILKATAGQSGATFKQRCGSNSNDSSADGTVNFTPNEVKNDSRSIFIIRWRYSKANNSESLFIESFQWFITREYHSYS